MNVRSVFGVIAWMLSSCLDASDVNSIVAISSDESVTSYVLAEVQRIEVSADDTEGTMTVVTKEGDEVDGYVRIIFASETTSLGDVDVPNVYIYPNPVSNFIYVYGIEEEDAHLTVYDMNGNCVMGRQGDEIDVTPLAKGTYLLGINDFYVKFIKQ